MVCSYRLNKLEGPCTLRWVTNNEPNQHRIACFDRRGYPSDRPEPMASSDVSHQLREDGKMVVRALVVHLPSALGVRGRWYCIYTHWFGWAGGVLKIKSVVFDLQLGTAHP